MITRAVLLVPSKAVETLSLVDGVIHRLRSIGEADLEPELMPSHLHASIGSTLVEQSPNHPAIVQIDVVRWQSNDVDLLELDRQFHSNEDKNRDCELWIRGGVDDAPGVPLQILTRYQRLLPLEGDGLPAWFSDVLAVHHQLFDLKKPLVRADFDHAHDTWRWVRRLLPNASPALQLAALFHDIERLVSEADKRIEHTTVDYGLFKRRHAEGSARIVSELLKRTCTPEAVVKDVAHLVMRHESPGDNEDLMLLNDADALSFFSLNSWGFVRYFDAAHVQKKVRYTLGRMRPTARDLLASLRMPPAVQYWIG
ncbi:MAG TPA: DUF4202 family protein [Polyangiaceae bacterium]